MDAAFEEIVQRVFKVPQTRDDMTAHDIPTWDSMNFLNLVAEFEKRFSMTFTMDEVVEAVSLGDLKKTIRARGKW